MDLKEAIYGRRAVREFTAEPVDEEVLRQLIDAAVQGPQRRQSAAMAVYGRTTQKAACAHFARGKSPYAQNIDGGLSITSFPERPRKS